MGHLLFQGGLERVEVGGADHGGFDDIGVVCRAARAWYAGSDGGGRIIDTPLVDAESDSGEAGDVDGRVEFQVDKLMAGDGTDISDPERPNW